MALAFSVTRRQALLARRTATTPALTVPATGRGADALHFPLHGLTASCVPVCVITGLPSAERSHEVSYHWAGHYPLTGSGILPSITATYCVMRVKLRPRTY